MIMFAATGALRVIKMTEPERCQVENDSARLVLVYSVARRFGLTNVLTALKESWRLIPALSRTLLQRMGPVLVEVNPEVIHLRINKIAWVPTYLEVMVALLVLVDTVNRGPFREVLTTTTSPPLRKMSDELSS
jgi:hypothetical protein